MPQHGGERFHVHPILQRQGRECVPEVVKTHLFAVCVLQNQLQSVVDRTGVERDYLDAIQLLEQPHTADTYCELDGKSSHKIVV